MRKTMFTATLLTIATKSTPSKYYPLIDEWINKLWYMLTMDYVEAIYHIHIPYSAIKKHALLYIHEMDES